LQVFFANFRIANHNRGQYDAMRREQTNQIRFIIEELLPPIIRDTGLFKFAATLAWGKHISRLADFRKTAPFCTAEEYDQLYRSHPRVHEDTDNSLACLQRIAADAIGNSVCDVGCGTGALLTHLRREAREPFAEMVGVDMIEADKPIGDGITFVCSCVEDLPFADKSFDTVVCTHVIEHILDFRRAIAEVRRIARRRLIIVVPREREGIYTFNPHLNFFPYRHSFLRAMIPVPIAHVCCDIGRDIYYMEDHAA
jgi:2-polyprenyl-3-methyl-5-hydroxy-6-metoxy-1,4-benzoquinol methylase